MKKAVFIFIIFFTFITAFGRITLKVGIYDDYPLCYYENNKAKGFYVDILDYIAEKEHWNIQYVYDTWENLLSKLRTGEIDSIVAIAYSEEREKLFNFNNVGFLSNWGILVSNHPIESLSEISNFNIALFKNDIYAQKFLQIANDFSINFNITWESSYEEILKLVNDKKVDAGIVSRLASIAYSNKYSYIETPIIFGAVDLKIAFSKNFTLSKLIIPKLDSYLIKLKNDPKSIYWKFYDKYFEKESLPFFWRIILFYVFPIFSFLILTIIIFIVLLRKKVKEKTLELSNLNKKLENNSKELARYQKNLIGILTIIQKLTSSKSNPQQFLKNIFDYVFEMIPKAESGSIYLIENDKIKFITAKGHNFKKLQKLDINKKQFIIPDEVEIIPGEVVMKFDNNSFSQEEIKILWPRPVKQMMLVPFKSSNETIGVISLEIYHINPESFNKTDKMILDSFSKIISIFYTLQKHSEIQEQFLKDVAHALIKALETHDNYTKGHSERVAYYASEFVKQLGYDKKVISKIYWSSILHDIGKLTIPSNILNKPTKLNNYEYQIIKQHPIIAYKIVKDIENFENIPEIIKHHHERYDGNGYPDGLKGEEIPYEARILAIVDAFDAMTSDRPYRKKLSIDEALNEIIKNAGRQFDPRLANLFVEMIINNPEIILKENK